MMLCDVSEGPVLFETLKLHDERPPLVLSFFRERENYWRPTTTPIRYLGNLYLFVCSEKKQRIPFDCNKLTLFVFRCIA